MTHILITKTTHEHATLPIEPRDFMSAKMLIDAFISRKGWLRTTDIICGIHYVNCLAVRSPEHLNQIATIEYIRYIMYNEFDIAFMDHRITDAGITFDFFEHVEDQLIDTYGEHSDRMSVDLQEIYIKLFEQQYYFKIGIYLQRIVCDYLRRIVIARKKLAGIVSFASFQYYLDIRCNTIKEII